MGESRFSPGDVDLVSQSDSTQDSPSAAQDLVLIFLRKWWFLIGLAVAIPLVVAAVANGLEQVYLVGDGAKIELLARDVWSTHTPYTGLIGRMNWNHPGPAMFWLLSPGALLARDDSAPLLVWNVILISVPLIGALVLAWGLGRRFFSVIVLSTLLALIALPVAVIRTPWNPWFPIPLLVLLFVLSARVVFGKTRDLIGVAIIGSIMVQTHVGTALIVASLAISAATFVAIDARRSRAMPNRWRSTVAWICASTVFLWILPVIGVFRDVGGNLVELGRYFVDAPGGSVGIRGALRLFADEYRWPIPWITGAQRILETPDILGYRDIAAQSHVIYILAPFGALIVGYLLASSATMRVWRRYIVMTAVLLLTGIIAISQADQALYYTFAWRGFIAPLAILIPSVPIVSRLIDRRRALTKVFAIGVAVACVMATVSIVPKMDSRSVEDPILLGALRSIVSVIDSKDISGEKVEYISRQKASLFGASLSDGVINELDRRGIDVVIPDNDRGGRAYGAHRIGAPSSASEVWYLVGSVEQFKELRTTPNAQLIWQASPYSTFAIFAIPTPNR
ncbi:MAG: hypothetical protein F2894_05320 [Actinobacteria bacterium]|uniref:Unannotated protein n=1 Tax=freshwater metagenome TaxID=449393 RepID=A0A6J6Y4I5_9ZZZZ|nr:hypothetical protein [Actinomycetota bacterium]MSX82219.1 hypothetical protein [Actinomycetota bacterium]